MRVKLTQEFVDSAKTGPGREREVFWDTETQSFGLVVTASGNRAYCVQYRIDGKSRRYTIRASQPLKKARNEAKGLLGRAARETTR